MLFNSYLFIFLFLPLSLLGYFGLNHMGKPKAALVFLTGMSLWFCGFGSLSYLVILLFSILVNYGIVALMNRTKNRGARKLPAASSRTSAGHQLLYLPAAVLCHRFLQRRMRTLRLSGICRLCLLFSQADPGAHHRPQGTDPAAA